jgi:hypothetical protein
MSTTFRRDELLRASKLNRAILERGAVAGEAAAAAQASVATAAQTAAQAAQAAAAASAAAAAQEAVNAAAAAATANGVIVLGTTGGTSSAYTITASVGPGANKVGKIKFHVTNAAHPVNLTWNGTTRSVRREDAGTLFAGMFDPAVEYFLIDTGSVYLVKEIRQSPKVFTSIDHYRTGIFNASWYQIGETAARAQQQVTEDGEILWRLSGDGTTLPAQAFQITGTSARHLRGNFLDRRNRALYSPFNPPAWGTDIALHASMGADRTKLDYGNETINVPSAEIYALSPPNQGKLARWTAGGYATAAHMSPGDEVPISVESGTLVLHTGYVGATQGSAPMIVQGLGTAKVAIPAPWHGKVRRQQGRITLAPDLGSSTVTTSTAALPQYARGIFWIGQSWADQESDSALFGMQEEFRRIFGATGWSILSARFTARGASGLWKNGVSNTGNPNNYWYDEDTNNLGPNATGSLAAIADALAAEGAPAIANWYGVFLMGLPDLLSLEAGGYYTPAQYTTDCAAFLTLFRAQLELLASGLGGAKIMMVPVPPQPPNVFNPLCYGPLRRAQLGVCTIDSNTVRGPDLTLEIMPFDNVHHYLEGRANHGRGLARVIANLEGGSELIGPKMVSLTRLATNSFRLQFNRNGCTALNRPFVPVGIGVALSTAALAPRLVIDQQSWIWGGTAPNDFVDFTTTGDDGVSAPVLYWPDLHAYETQERSRTPYAFDALGRPLACLTYHPTV